MIRLAISLVLSIAQLAAPAAAGWSLCLHRDGTVGLDAGTHGCSCCPALATHDHDHGLETCDHGPEFCLKTVGQAALDGAPCDCRHVPLGTEQAVCLKANDDSLRMTWSPGGVEKISLGPRSAWSLIRADLLQQPAGSSAALRALTCVVLRC